MNKKPLKRAKAIEAFKRNLVGFVLWNFLFWVLWLANAGKDYFKDMRGIPWPAWITLGWGLVIAFYYFRAYHGNKYDLTEKETSN